MLRDRYVIFAYTNYSTIQKIPQKIYPNYENMAVV